jgi:hypothetical protein
MERVADLQRVVPTAHGLEGGRVFPGWMWTGGKVLGGEVGGAETGGPLNADIKSLPSSASSPRRVLLLRRWEPVREVVWKNVPRILVKLNMGIVLSCDFDTS